jgi:hypothetical protein
MRKEYSGQGPYPRGECRDVLIGPDGRCIWRRDWQHNLIVEGLGNLLAALVKGDAQASPLTFWAVGSGDVTWDSGTLPPEAALRTRTRLYHETGRKAIPPGQIAFLGGTFTNQLEIGLEFTTADVPGGDADWQLREFAVFAGGTMVADSGVMINHRIHPRIDLQPGFTLQRTLRLTF